MVSHICRPTRQPHPSWTCEILAPGPLASTCTKGSWPCFTKQARLLTPPAVQLQVSTPGATQPEPPLPILRGPAPAPGSSSAASEETWQGCARKIASNVSKLFGISAVGCLHHPAAHGWHGDLRPPPCQTWDIGKAITGQTRAAQLRLQLGPEQHPA